LAQDMTTSKGWPVFLVRSVQDALWAIKGADNA
jgi:hypothetical protein